MVFCRALEYHSPIPSVGLSALTLFFSFYQLTPLFTVRFQEPGTCFSNSRQARSALLGLHGAQRNLSLKESWRCADIKRE